LTDPVADPPGAGGESTPERLIRHPSGFGCFAPRLESPPVVPPPCGADGPLTFGATHKPLKLNDKVLDLWAEVLRAVPDARLLLYRDALQGSVAEGFRNKMVARGVEGQRILIRTPAPGEDYLRV
jgi:predicted O-linked N-acetylglucosamine transferase (SPINDLY family)